MPDTAAGCSSAGLPSSIGAADGRLAGRVYRGRYPATPTDTDTTLSVDCASAVVRRTGRPVSAARPRPPPAQSLGLSSGRCIEHRSGADDRHIPGMSRPPINGGMGQALTALGRHSPFVVASRRSITRMSLGDEAVDGLVGVVLKGRVGQVGEDIRLVDQGTLQLVGRAGVEHATRKVRVGDTVDQSLCAILKFV